MAIIHNWQVYWLDQLVSFDRPFRKASDSGRYIEIVDIDLVWCSRRSIRRLDFFEHRCKFWRTNRIRFNTIIKLRCLRLLISSSSTTDTALPAFSCALYDRFTFYVDGKTCWRRVDIDPNMVRNYDTSNHLGLQFYSTSKRTKFSRKRLLLKA